jgi:hypothetical protein
MLDDRKSHMHTHNPAHKKIPKVVDLHTSDQRLISHIGELVGNIAPRVAIVRGAAGLRKMMVLYQMVTGVRCSAINWLYMSAIGILPTLLRVLTSE